MGMPLKDQKKTKGGCGEGGLRNLSAAGQGAGPARIQVGLKGNKTLVNYGAQVGLM